MLSGTQVGGRTSFEMEGSTLRLSHGEADGSQRSPGARGVLVTAIVAVALMAGASSASAVIVHLKSGKTISYQPLRSQRSGIRPFDAFFSNLDYNGGPVMASNTNYVVYWRPSGAPAYPPDYQQGVNQYFEDLGHDSGGKQNVDSISSQYNDAAGEFANYDSHFGGALIDTDPYPASGCFAALICLTDEQLREELVRFVKAKGLPTDLAHEYFLLTPPEVEGCFEESGVQCSAGSAEPYYCAYHENIPLGAEGQIIYSNDPYVTEVGGCDDGNHPNGSTADGVIQGGLTHEHNESITDPEPNNAWTDFATGKTTGYEVGDKCNTGEQATEFGPQIGVASNGAVYNQVVSGHFYWYQQEWSNQKHECMQRFTLNGPEPVATFTVTPGTGKEMKFDATGSTSGAGVHYNWQFNDLSGHNPNKPVETSSPSISHTFPTSEAYRVALTVFTEDGTSIGAARTAKGGVVVEAPSVVTGPASPISQTGATLHATVNANGNSVTRCRFEFGTSLAYGSRVACAALPGSGTSPVSVAASVGGLAANTAYHFRVAATNAGGTTTGADQTFTTPSNPPPPAAEATAAVAPPASIPVVALSPASPLTAAPNSNFSPLRATFNTKTGVITLTGSVRDPGTFKWLLTFQNGKFGVFAASTAKCKQGFVRLKGKCRPSAIMYAKGSKLLAAPGTVRFTTKPSASALRALKNALKQKRGLPVAIRLTFQSSRGGSAVSHTQSLMVRLKTK
jgi:hypothetical protein